MSGKNKLAPSLAFHREKKGETRDKGQGKGNKNERRKIRERRHSRPFHPLPLAFHHFISPWLDGRAGWLEPGKEKKLGKKGARGGGGVAADIAKELHVTRKFVYTMSAPLAPCNVY